MRRRIEGGRGERGEEREQGKIKNTEEEKKR